MLTDTNKSGTTRCPQDKPSWCWAALTSMSTAGVKDIGLTLLLIAMCVYNLSKLMIIQRVWAKSTSLLPDWLNGRSIDKRIDVMTAELRMEMRELSEQIIEFQKWSQIISLDQTGGAKSKSCQQCKGKMLPMAGMPIFMSSTFIHPKPMGNEISDCNWLQYLHKYVYNPNPRILDTSELENTKRAYSM